eukprot:10102661-Karenia_brevis.AAC.1
MGIEFQVRRVAFFVRLANSPTASWQQAAFTYHCMHRSPWFSETFDILLELMPSLRIYAGECVHGYCTDSPGSWSDVGQWNSVLALGFPRDVFGKPSRHAPRVKEDSVEQAVRRHTQAFTQQSRLRLQRSFRSNLFWR